MLGRRLAQVHVTARRRRSSERQTFIALRACRKAIKVARGMRFGKPIDVVHMHCQACGVRVDCSQWDEEVGVVCPACGAGVRVPGYLRGAVRRAWEEEHELSRYGQEMEAILPAEPLDWSDKVEVVRGSIEESRALKVVERGFIKRCSVLVLMAIALGTAALLGMWSFAMAMR